MNFNQVLNMVMRQIVRRTVNGGINAGMNMASNGIKRKPKQLAQGPDYGHPDMDPSRGTADLEDEEARLRAELRRVQKARQMKQGG